MNDCVFCQIAARPAGEKYRIFYSDDRFYAMLVSHPETRGHFIVVPRKHFSDLSELTDSGSLFETGIRLADMAIARLVASAYTLKLNNRVYLLDSGSGHIGHIHLHVIPYSSGSDLPSGQPDKVSREVLSDLCQLLAGQSR